MAMPVRRVPEKIPFNPHIDEYYLQAWSRGIYKLLFYVKIRILLIKTRNVCGLLIH
jgi:hypothetical protein